MYWPIATPRVYAASSSKALDSNLVSQDGLPSNFITGTAASESAPSQSSLLAVPQDETDLLTPATPATPAVQSLDVGHGHDADSVEGSHDAAPNLQAPNDVPLRDPILALRISRAGHLFATITATTMTLWQTKPAVILAVVVRSPTSLKSYGSNVDLFLRPDSAIFVIHTSLGYLITYSLAMDAESRVYKPHFPSYTNVQKRRQNHTGDPGNLAPDQFLWGPGEGGGVRDVSIRFRMVIKVDAGIESALALDDELVVATRKPAAVQCIRWTPDQSGNQTRTEILSRMSWLEKKVIIVEMTHDRPMNLSTWITSDGRTYAVQRLHGPNEAGDSAEQDPKKLFKGYCFHVPSGPDDRAIRAVINARFSLIAIGCAGGAIHVYSARDYAGNIPPSHKHRISISSNDLGPLTSLSYSPDGYCLFSGYKKGWATWSVYGKLGSQSFTADDEITPTNGEQWLSGVTDAAWVSGASALLLTSPNHDAVWSLEMAKSAVTGCYSSSNIFRTVLQTETSVMVYRGYDLPDLTTISAEPFLWHTANVPPSYLLNQWPIRCTTISPDGRYIAVAGRRGLAHYSINSGRWKTFANELMENEFQVRGGMCWYRHILVAAIEANKSYELRLFSRETALDSNQVLHAQQIPAPVVLVASSGEDSLLVYTYENLLYHFVFAPWGGSVRLVQVGQIAFNGIVRSPARVRGLSWILPESQLVEGDPSQDVAVASVLFLVDGKLVLLQPSMGDEGQLRYDMRVVAQNVEFHATMRDQPFTNLLESGSHDHLPSTADDVSLRNSLWVFDGVELKVWPDMQDVLHAASGEAHRELPPAVSVPVDFYPLSVLLGKGIVLGVEPDLVQRRDINFSFFRFSIRTHLFLPDILRFYLAQSKSVEALALSRLYQELEYFPHALEILLHRVLDEEVDSAPTPEDAVLPRVLSLLSSFRQYLDIVLQCTRKTEVRSWRTLFAYLPPARELFEESFLRGSLKTAAGYLLILHTLDELESVSEQSVRLLSRAMREQDWDLCKELARFLAALDETGGTLREAVEMAELRRDEAMSRLEVPRQHLNGSRPRDDGANDETESDMQSTSDPGSFGSGSASDGGNGTGR